MDVVKKNYRSNTPDNAKSRVILSLQLKMHKQIKVIDIDVTGVLRMRFLFWKRDYMTVNFMEINYNS